MLIFSKKFMKMCCVLVIIFLRSLVLITCFRKYCTLLFGLFSSYRLMAGELVKQSSFFGFIFITESIMIFYT